MAMVINSNIQSLNAQRHLSNSLQDQNMATERLASGKRINSAADDAAGLAIANRMTSQVEGLNQAIRNANDGAALIQTAEGGLEEMTNILQRMRELSIQSANGTYDTGNRDTLNAEVTQLQEEINRIAETTSFNGLNILDGSLGQVDLQVGENANQTIALEIDSLTTKNLGGEGGDLVGTAGTAALLTGLQAFAASTAGSALIINGDSVQALSAATTLEEAVNMIDESVAGVNVSSFVELEAGAATGGNGALSGTDELRITIEMADGSTDRVINIQDTKDMQDLVNKINEEGGDTLQASISEDGQLVLSSELADSIAVAGAGDGLANAGFSAAVTQEAQLKFEITDDSIESISVDVGTALDSTNLNAVGLNQRDEGSIVASTTAAFGAALGENQLQINDVTIGAATGAGLDATISAINKHTAETGVTAVSQAINTTGDFALKLISNEGDAIKIESGTGFTSGSEQERDIELRNLTGLLATNEAETTSSTVASIDISTAEGAQRAIGILDDAIAQVSETRGELGAVSNRLDHTTRNLSNIAENASAARSQIMDADFAAESANLSRAQVLQQAGNAMLAQANSRPQQVLSLLQ